MLGTDLDGRESETFPRPSERGVLQVPSFRSVERYSWKVGSKGDLSATRGIRFFLMWDESVTRGRMT